jgi:hypothetical protein
MPARKLAPTTLDTAIIKLSTQVKLAKSMRTK